MTEMLVSQAPSLSALLDRGTPSGQAFVVPDGDQLSYGQLADSIESLAAQLVGAGVRRGDRVALAMPNLTAASRLRRMCDGGRPARNPVPGVAGPAS